MNTAQFPFLGPACRWNAFSCLRSRLERAAGFIRRRSTRFGLLGVALPLFMATVSFGASDAIEAVKRADAARIKATLAHDRTLLGELLSEDLVYGQNDRRVQSKAEFLLTLTVSQNKYDSIDVDDAKYVEVAPGVVAMSGRATVKGLQAAKQVNFTIKFLAVYRSEAGKWRLVAYQSARLVEPGGAVPTK